MQQKFVRIMCLILVIIMAVTIIFPPFFMAFAKTATQEKYEDLQAQLDDIQDDIDGTKNATDKKEKEKEQLATQASLVQSQIDTLLADITVKEEEISVKQQELDAKQVEISENEDLFAQRLRANYMQQNQGILSTILGVTSFGELLTSADALQRLTQSENELLVSLGEDKTEIESSQAILDADMAALEEIKATLDTKEKELDQMLTNANTTLSQLETTLAQQQADKDVIYQQYVDAKAAFEAEWAGLQGQDDTPFVGGTFSWPVPAFATSSNISSGYGYRPNPFNPAYQEMHTGIDISGAGIGGAIIRASNSGTVVRASYSTYGYGNCIIIDHGGGYQTLYGHCRSLNVKVGDFVTKDQTIATVGTTGNSTGNHLHFEVRINGAHTNPLPYLQG